VLPPILTTSGFMLVRRGNLALRYVFAIYRNIFFR
jgi:hypothetical protein